MNRAQVEAFLFRWQALYPSAPRLDDVEAAVRLEEWMATPEIVDCPIAVGEEAFGQWKSSRDWPPTPHQFIEFTDQILTARRRQLRQAEQTALLAEYDETIAPPEVARRHIEQVRSTIRKMRRRTGEVLDP